MFAPMSGDHSTSQSKTQHSAFFRQSGWMMIATIGGGALMWAVHFLSKKVPPGEYGLFVSVLALISCVPTMPLQMMFTQQAARAEAAGTPGQISYMLRLAFGVTLGLAALLCGVIYLAQGSIEQSLHLPNATELWLVVAILFFSVWLPILSGLLQGLQNFLWLGWTLILTAFGRFGVAAVLVLVLGWYSVGMLTGVLLGSLTGVVLGLWQTRPVWRRQPEAFVLRPVLAQVIPLLLGFGAVQFLFTADTLFVKAFFPADQTGFYGGAGTLARALLWVVQPLSQVMFPKLVHSATRKEKSNLLGLVLLGTLILAALGALSLTVLRHWVIRFVFTPEYEAVGASILPWYAWAIVPLALANVLANGVLAKGQFQVVPVLVLLGALYGVALYEWHGSLIQVLQIMGGFNLLLLAVCGWFTWRQPAPAAPVRPV